MTVMPYDSPCQFIAAASGAADFVVSSAASDFSTPEQAGATDGKGYRYLARLPDGSVWEWGLGAYSYATHTLQRTTIYSTSIGGASPVNFAAAPIVVVFPSRSSTLEQPFPPGTRMLFQQTAAPVGWTKVTTFDDCTLRVVAGTAGSGGSNGFSTVNAQATVGATTLSIGQIPQHLHTAGLQDLYGDAPGNTGNPMDFTGASGTGAWATPTTGGLYGSSGGQSHTHTISMNLKYVDVIIASKNP